MTGDALPHGHDGPMHIENSRGAAEGMSEVHISSILVHCADRRLAAITSAIGRLGGAEVHASNPNGKLIVTLETRSEAETLDRIGAIGALDGVLAASLVYHQVDEGEGTG